MKQIFLFKRSNCHCPRSVCVMKSLKVTSHYKYSKSVGAFFDKWTDREMENGFEEESGKVGRGFLKKTHSDKQTSPARFDKSFPLWQNRDMTVARFCTVPGPRDISRSFGGGTPRLRWALCQSAADRPFVNTWVFTEKNFCCTCYLFCLVKSQHYMYWL